MGYASWLHTIAAANGKGVANNIDARGLGRAADEIDTLRKALADVKDLVCGDKVPNWVDDFVTCQTRGKIADLCDTALQH